MGKEKIGFEGQMLIEPKPKEPTRHQYDYDAMTVIGSLRQFDLIEHFKLNIEPITPLWLDTPTSMISSLPLSLECWDQLMPIQDRQIWAGIRISSRWISALAPL